MKHMFAGDPWYNGQGQQGGVQGMGFRPGPVQIAIVNPMAAPAPIIGQSMQVAPMQQQAPLLSQAQAQQPQPQQQRPQNPGQQKVPMGSKANCPVCRNFGG